MRILLVASDRMEFTGILHHTADARAASIPVDWARAGKLNGNEVLLVANGVGAQRAGEAVDAAIQNFPAEAVVSTGFCGALHEELEIADLVSANVILPQKQTFSLRLCVSARNSFQGPVISVDHVVRTAEEKRQLRSSGAYAVEMEAAGVASRASAHGLPFFCVRAVTDLAGETLANDFNAALRSDGHFDTMIILGQALRHPRTCIPELLRLRGRCSRAARVLGDFFADCGF